MSDNHDEARRRAAGAFALTALTTLLAVMPQNTFSLQPVPMRTSILSGQMWLDELLAGHPKRFREQFGMSKYTFRQLSCELQLHSGLLCRIATSAIGGPSITSSCESRFSTILSHCLTVYSSLPSLSRFDSFTITISIDCNTICLCVARC